MAKIAKPSDVFEPLSKLSTEAFTETAYQMLLLLRHRNLLSNTSIDDFLKLARSQGLVKTNSALRLSLQQSIDNIETAENLPLEKITDGNLQKYRRDLDELLYRNATADQKSPSVTGQRVLQMLRNTPLSKSSGSISTSVKAKPTSRKVVTKNKANMTSADSKVENSKKIRTKSSSLKSGKSKKKAAVKTASANEYPKKATAIFA